MIAIFMAVLGVLLFTVLDARRQSLNAPAVKPGALDRTSPGAEAPPLYVPPPPPSAPVEPPVQQVQPAPAPALPPPQPQIIYVPQPAPPQQQAAPQQPPRVAGDPALVIDTTSGEAPAGGPGATGAVPPNAAAGGPDSSTRSPGIAGGRVRVAQFANRSSTVPQGTLIPAVLETGLDSTRPGLARAMVTKDVRGFDGTRILIPRGSRLIGEYQAEASPGQKRALVNWIRLIRPDGATIAIGSPVSDPVGRGGMKAKVDNHFFARFTGAILQSALDIGVNLASRSANSPVIVALPGTVQQTTQPLTQQTQQVTPTLKVSPGTSITVFVARDLDFSGADNKP
ncbi:TrbI/VirB10 family protein [Sphingomonas sp.]|uniref:TrbI/VirB10 family protein n=1 Tax=Sphingomonas sp. TaxID=28214 RepID=UPI0025EBBB18|nr:TrbI/VirB10 family protein [Sphingomonas sp.]